MVARRHRPIVELVSPLGTKNRLFQLLEVGVGVKQYRAMHKLLLSKGEIHYVFNLTAELFPGVVIDYEKVI